MPFAKAMPMQFSPTGSFKPLPDNEFLWRDIFRLAVFRTKIVTFSENVRFGLGGRASLSSFYASIPWLTT